MFIRFLLYVSFLYAMVNQSHGYNIPGESESPFNEMPCIVLGGMCTVSDAGCQGGRHVTTKGLCPNQEDKGVECCHHVPKEVSTCRSRGGECTDSSARCPENLTYRNTIDCNKNQKCCVLVV